MTYTLPLCLVLTAVSLIHSARGNTPDELRAFNILKFGNTAQDYIIYKPDMGPLESAFTVCSWIRRLRSSTKPVWFSYSVSSQAKEIQITDDGYHFFMFGDISDLSSVYTVSPGTWFHICLAWSVASQTRNLYINGAIIDTRATPADRRLGQDGYLLFGNEQDGLGTGMDSSEIFGGEMYKLNVFSKMLSTSEIQQMAGDMCSNVEESYGDTRHIRWEDVIQLSRSGNVQEKASGCLTVSLVHAMIQKKVEPVERKLNETLIELANSKREQENVAEKFNDTLIELANGKVEIEKTKKHLNGTLVELADSMKKQEITATTLNETQIELANSKGNLENIKQQLNETLVELAVGKEALEKTETTLKETAQKLNQTLTRVEELEETINSTPDCHLNSTITSDFDFLYSDTFYGQTMTTEKLDLVKRILEKLEHFVGIRITDRIIEFFKLYLLRFE